MSIRTVRHQKKDRAEQAIGRSRDGRGNKVPILWWMPAQVGWLLPDQWGGTRPRQPRALLPAMRADTPIADNASKSDEQVLEPMAAAGKAAVIPRRTKSSVAVRLRSASLQRIARDRKPLRQTQAVSPDRHSFGRNRQQHAPSGSSDDRPLQIPVSGERAAPADVGSWKAKPAVTTGIFRYEDSANQALTG